jgi:acyl-CoA synthetase (NDP forming)
MSITALSRLFNPRSVAIVGASATPGKIGSRVVENLVGQGFSGEVYPVNPRGSEISGIPAVTSISELPGPVDVAYVLIPADAAVDAAQELAELETGYIIVAAAEFAEAGTPEGRHREDALRDIAAKTGTRIVGPNCNGIYSSTHQVSIGFNTAHGERHRPGGVAILSHSGALFSTIMLRAKQAGMGLSAFVSDGNECDLDVLDYLEHFVDDEHTRCIALIIDSLPDGDRFRALVSAARAHSKSVIALKLGTSAEGASAAVAHSSRMAGSGAAYRAFLEDAGVGVVRTVEELVTAGVLLDSDEAFWAGGRVGVAALSGGAGTLVADTAVRHGLAVPPLSAATRERIAEIAPNSRLENPIDLGGGYGRLDVPTMFSLLAEDTNVDIVVHFHHPMHTPEERRSIAESFSRSRNQSAKPHIVIAPGGVTDEERSIYRDAGVPIIPDTETAMAAIAAAHASSEPISEAGRDDVQTSPFESGLSGVLNDVDSITLLAEAGVPMASMAAVNNPSEAVNAAVEVGRPVVLKGLLSGVAHKSDLGLVVVGVEGEETVRSEAERLFGLGAERVLVQQAVHGEIEALLGIVHEPRIGHFLMFGLGGVFAEAINDVAMVPVTASAERIRTALARTRLGAVLASPRWRGADSIDQFVAACQALARFARRHGEHLEAVDINPVLISRETLVGVDGMVVLSAEDPVPAA